MKLKFSYKKILPVILQSEITECGLACICMIANYYGYQKNLISLRKQFNSSSKGINMQELSNLFSIINISTRAIKLELEELKYLKTPCILH